MPTGIMLTSLFENNSGVDIRVHLLHNGILADDKAKLTEIARRYGQTVVFYLIDEARFRTFPIGLDFQNTHVGLSYATYYRLLLTEILPSDISRVIYLDGDMIVVDSLLDLWNMDVEGVALAAVPDSYNNRIEPYNRLRYPQDKGYFNAGLLVINLDYWRENNVVDSFYDYVAKNRDSLACHDQDILNFVFCDRKKNLPLRYNMLNEYWFKPECSVVSWEFSEQMIFGQKHPVVVHFTGLPKPWYSNCRHPMKPVFERYRDMTVWREYKERRWVTAAYLLENTAGRILVALGLRDKQQLPNNRYVKM